MAVLAKERRAEEQSSRTGHLWLTAVLLILGLLFLSAGMLYFAFAEEQGNRALEMLTHPKIVAMNTLPVFALGALFFFLTGRGWAAWLLTALPLGALTVGNYYKLLLRNDPVVMEDLFLLKEAAQISGRYTFELHEGIVIYLAGAAAILLLLLLPPARCAVKNRRARVIGSMTAGSAVVLIVVLCRNTSLYNLETRNEESINRWNTAQVHCSKGIIYPFLHSAVDLNLLPPEGYSKWAAAAMLEEYTDEDIPEDEKVDLFFFQLEAFNDFSRFSEVPVDESVYADWHALEDESVSGSLVTNIFAGGTVDTERCVLTGLSNYGSLRMRTNSYAWYLRSQGYTAEGSHPSYDWFYSRKNINENLGFENYYFLENYYEPFSGGWGLCMDEVLFPEVLSLYRAHLEEDDRPYFSFNVTYQGHGPYDTEEDIYGENCVTDTRGLSEEAVHILNNYFGLVRDSGAQITSFVDELRDSDRPVVVVLFGDHNPWLGDGGSVYEELGIDLDTEEAEGFLNYYSTRYLIWANDKAKEVLGQSFEGEGPTISSNFLMNEVFMQCGWAGNAYMQATSAVMSTTPVISSATDSCMENGVLLESSENLWRFRCLEYYRRKNFAG